MNVSDEKKARDLQYEKVLHDYQEKKRHLTLAKEREAHKVFELYAKDASSYNFDIAQKKVSHNDY